MYIVQYDGDFIDHHKLERNLEAFETFDQAMDRLEGFFFNKEAYYNLPDEEDDRIVIYECDPGNTPSLRAVWGFFGWHWSKSDFPELPDDSDILRNGKSLYQVMQELDEEDEKSKGIG